MIEKTNFKCDEIKEKFKLSQFNNYFENKKKSEYFIFNSLTGSICKLSAFAFFALKNFEIIDGMDYKFLIKKKFIVPKDLNEINYIILSQKQLILSQKTSSLVFTICPTLLCNLSCVYCFENEAKNKVKMDKKIASQTIDFIKNNLNQNSNIKNIHIVWFGGEPLLEIGIIKYITNELKLFCKEKEINYSASIITNGIFIDKILSDLEQLSINSIQVTMDGDKKFYMLYKMASEKDYSRVIENILNVDKKNIHISVRLNVSVENKKSVIKITKELLNREYKGIFYVSSLYYDSPNNKKHFTVMNKKEFITYIQDFNFEMKDYKKQNGNLNRIKFRAMNLTCASMYHTNAVIGPDGRLYKCEHSLGNQSEVVGSVFTGFNYNDVFMKYLDYKPRERCYSCSVFPMCMGGCFKDNINNIDINCEQIKKNIEDSVFRILDKIIIKDV